MARARHEFVAGQAAALDGATIELAHCGGGVEPGGERVHRAIILAAFRPVRARRHAAHASRTSLAQSIKEWGRELGFQQVGIAGVDLAADEQRLAAWLAQGRHGTMEYMERHGTRRSRPAELMPGTIRVVSARMDYRVEAADPEAVLNDPLLGYVSRYALGRDYHKVLRHRLAQLAGPHRRRGRHRGLSRLHRQRARAGEGAGARCRARLDRQAHQPARPARRLVVLPGRDLHRPAAAASTRR